MVEFNNYAQWEGLTITAEQIKNKKLLCDCDTEFIYAGFDGAQKNNINKWYIEGDKPFINHYPSKEETQNRLKDVYNQGWTIVTYTIKSREYLINLIHPDWINNVKEGQNLLCKNNDKGSKKDKRFFNGRNYIVYEVVKNDYVYQYMLHEEGKPNNLFTVNKTELYENFQPPRIICIQKGQGTDFENVLLYIGNRDTTMVNRNSQYTAITRSRNQYEIILDDTLVFRRNVFCLCQTCIRTQPSNDEGRSGFTTRENN
jgi:hypothetical protein